jgi:hypothetical protein
MNTSKRLRSISVAINFLLPVCLASLIFCLFLTSAARATELKAELVHKVWEGEAIGAHTGQVQLTFPDGRIKLLEYRSHLEPLVADGKVYIFTTKNGNVTGILVYDSAKGRGQSFPLPDDLKQKFNSYFGQPSFSPDGTKVAYYITAGEINSESQPGFIDRTGKKVKAPTFQRQAKGLSIHGEFSKRSFRVRMAGKVGFKNISGNLVIPPRFADANDFAEGLASVQVGKKWGFIDKTGKFIIPPRYHYARSFSEGLAAVNIGGKWDYGKWIFIDKMGKMVIPVQYDRALNFSEGLAGVLVDGKYGFIDKAGKMIIQPQFDDVQDFFNGMAKVYYGAREPVHGGVRVRSWPDWHLLWQSPLCPLTPTDAPPQPPIWESKSRVEFDPEFFDPPRFLSFQVPEGEKGVQ